MSIGRTVGRREGADEEGTFNFEWSTLSEEGRTRSAPHDEKSRRGVSTKFKENVPDEEAPTRRPSMPYHSSVLLPRGVFHSATITIYRFINVIVKI